MPGTCVKDCKLNLQHFKGNPGFGRLGKASFERTAEVADRVPTYRVDRNQFGPDGALGIFLRVKR